MCTGCPYPFTTDDHFIAYAGCLEDHTVVVRFGQFSGEVFAVITAGLLIAYQQKIDVVYLSEFLMDVAKSGEGFASK
jgi:hypothetical protein